MTRLANAPLGLRSFLLCLRPFELSFSGLATEGFMSKYTHLTCSRCGARVSNNFLIEDQQLIVRAFVECGDCIEKQPDYETRIKEYEQEAVFLRDRHIAQQNQLVALESRLQEERARILQIIEKEKHWVQYDFQPDLEDSPNSVGAWVCERLAEEIETYPHLACLANTENKTVNENDGDWRDKAYRGEDY